jgi:CBS domain-containing protein
MFEDNFFFRDNVVDIDAAVVGVSKTKWDFTDQEVGVEQAREIMAQRQFDVLPIVTDTGTVREYFHTRTWNDYDSVERREIDYSDVISFRTPLHALIKEFAKEKKLFYFLANEGRVIGLVSIANLNCRQVRTFIFNLISELEIRLSQFLSSEVSDVEMLKLGIRSIRTGRAGKAGTPSGYLAS